MYTTGDCSNNYFKTSRACERCNSIESTGIILKWYWNSKKDRMQLLCALCAYNISNEEQKTSQKNELKK